MVLLGSGSGLAGLGLESIATHRQAFVLDLQHIIGLSQLLDGLKELCVLRRVILEEILNYSVSLLYVASLH